MEIRTENLDVFCDVKQILKGLSLEVKKNQFVGIIGPNGSGKSTLLKCLYRILHPAQGAIYLNGQSLEDLTYKETARQMAVVAQHNHYQFDFTVQDIVLMGRTPYKGMFDKEEAEDYEIMERSLELVDLRDYKDREFSTLSGGEQQRVILARALTQEPDCLILDEPTNHLDIKHQLSLLAAVKKLNLTVLAAIHDLNMAAMYCDVIYVLNQGKIEAVGSPKEVLTRDLIRKIYQVEAELVHDQKGQMHILFVND